MKVLQNLVPDLDIELLNSSERRGSLDPDQKKQRRALGALRRRELKSRGDVLGLPAMVEHHLVRFPPDARLLAAAEGRIRRARQTVPVRPKRQLTSDGSSAPDHAD
jgi:hypothetical protein